MFRSLANWIASTSLSQAFQDMQWVVPTSQSIHLAAIGVVLGVAIFVNLRLLGLSRSRRSVAEMADTLFPWLWGGLTVLLITGIVQTIAEPGRQLNTPHFRWKMVMVAAVAALTFLFQRSVRARAAVWNEGQATPVSARLFAVLSLALWIGIVVCGRTIAYVWERYE